jgi:hypothetical protein
MTISEEGDENDIAVAVHTAKGKRKGKKSKKSGSQTSSPATSISDLKHVGVKGTSEQEFCSGLLNLEDATCDSHSARSEDFSELFGKRGQYAVTKEEEMVKVTLPEPVTENVGDISQASQETSVFQDDFIDCDTTNSINVTADTSGSISADGHHSPKCDPSLWLADEAVEPSVETLPNTAKEDSSSALPDDAKSARKIKPIPPPVSAPNFYVGQTEIYPTSSSQTLPRTSSGSSLPSSPTDFSGQRRKSTALDPVLTHVVPTSTFVEPQTGVNEETESLEDFFEDHYDSDEGYHGEPKKMTRKYSQGNKLSEMQGWSSEFDNSDEHQQLQKALTSMYAESSGEHGINTRRDQQQGECLLFPTTKLCHKFGPCVCPSLCPWPLAPGSFQILILK